MSEELIEIHFDIEIYIYNKNLPAEYLDLCDGHNR